jgi:hypothetical protein
MSYSPSSAIVMRINNATTSVGSNQTVDLDLGRSVVGASRYENKDLTSVNGHGFIALCDVIYSGSGNAIQFASAFAGSSGSVDKSRQVPLSSTSSVIARDEFWGRGSGLSPQGQGLSLTNCTVNIGDCVLGAVIHD